MDILLVILSVVILSLTYNVLFWFTHREPLTNQQVERLSQGRKNKYINNHFQFTHEFRGVNPEYRASLDREGRWDRIDIPLKDIISLLAQLLRYKRHEWSVWCLTDEFNAKLLWANKGDDNMSCYFKGYITPDFVFSNNCHTIIHIHNHPQTATFHAALAPSQTDKNTLAAQIEKWSKYGINFIDAVCTRGSFVIFGYSFAPDYYPPGSFSEEIKTENGISKQKNYRLHLELRKLKGVKIKKIE